MKAHLSILSVIFLFILPHTKIGSICMRRRYSYFIISFFCRKKFAKPIDKSEKVCYNNILHYNRSDYASGWMSGGGLCGEKLLFT